MDKSRNFGETWREMTIIVIRKQGADRIYVETLKFVTYFDNRLHFLRGIRSVGSNVQRPSRHPQCVVPPLTLLIRGAQLHSPTSSVAHMNSTHMPAGKSFERPWGGGSRRPGRPAWHPARMPVRRWYHVQHACSCPLSLRACCCLALLLLAHGPWTRMAACRPAPLHARIQPSILVSLFPHEAVP